MIKSFKTLKIQGYDNFKCTADKCKFTCCSGWDINIDNNTFIKWNAEKSICKPYLTNIIPSGDEGFIMNKRTSEACPFLNDNKLCKIVIDNGQDYISHTCRTFPRINNEINNVIEKSLTCSCPEVVEMIDSNILGSKMLLEEEISAFDLPIEVSIRNKFVEIIERKELSLEVKLLVCFKFIKSLYEMEELSEEMVVLELIKYSDENIIKIANEIKNDKNNVIAALKEVNLLFLDITNNYKYVNMFKDSLLDIAETGINMSEISDISKWETFIKKFNKHNDLIQNIIISKINSLCLNEDIGETTISIQIILLEYILIRYSTYLRFLINYDVKKDFIKDYIVIYSRIMENNIEAVLDYIYENFGDEILQNEYLNLICLS